MPLQRHNRAACFDPSRSLRADFAGGGLSSDLGPLLLKGVDREIGLTERVCAAINDTRHPGYITHSLHDILKQRIYQIASGYEDGTFVLIVIVCLLVKRTNAVTFSSAKIEWRLPDAYSRSTRISVHVPSESLFTFAQKQCSRCSRICSFKP